MYDRSGPISRYIREEFEFVMFSIVYLSEIYSAWFEMSLD